MPADDPSLAHELGLPADAAPLAKLSRDELAAVQGRFHARRASQRTALAAAIDAALAQVPWVLRAAVRKVLFP